MNPRLRSFSTRLALSALVATASGSASPPNALAYSNKFKIGPASGANELAISIAVVGSASDAGTYLALHRDHNLTGCATSTSNGPELLRQGHKHPYALVGDLADIKFGDRIRVSGREEKEDAGGARQFLVEKVTKDLGACAARPVRSRVPVAPITQIGPRMQ